MKKIIFIGTSSGFPSRYRASSSFILSADDKLYQFDAGEGFSGSALRNRIKYNNIEKIFISHLHPDHITGIFLELQMMYLDGRKKPLDIYVPREALDGLQKAMDLFYLFKEKFPFCYRFKPLKPNPAFRAQSFSLYVYPNLHLEDNGIFIRKKRKPNKMQSYGYMININGKRILYSGDVSNENDLIDHLGNVHTLIVDGFHIDFQSLVEMTTARKVKRLVLTHLEDKLFDNPRKLFKIAEKAGVRKLIIAYDGLILRI